MAKSVWTCLRVASHTDRRAFSAQRGHCHKRCWVEVSRITVSTDWWGVIMMQKKKNNRGESSCLLIGGVFSLGAGSAVTGQSCGWRGRRLSGGNKNHTWGQVRMHLLAKGLLAFTQHISSTHFFPLCWMPNCYLNAQLTLNRSFLLWLISCIWRTARGCPLTLRKDEGQFYCRTQNFSYQSRIRWAWN